MIDNSLACCFLYLRSLMHHQGIVAALSDSVALSAGSACHTQPATGSSSQGGPGGVVLSPVLQAMGVPVEWGVGSLRLSVGRHTSLADVDKACRAIAETLVDHRVKQ
jgi:cysteine sulfinate desulfinase/cysteine desulfurase-like protein